MQKYKCRVCGYTYDPEKGEPRQKTDAGTDFKELPELWRCPVCGAGKIKFDESK